MRFFSDCKTDEERKQLYRKLSKLFHPDHGGDAEMMTELNKQYSKPISSFSEEFKPKSNFTHPFGNATSHEHVNTAPNYESLKRANALNIELHERIASQSSKIRDLYDVLQTKDRIIVNQKSHIETLRERSDFLLKEKDNLDNECHFFKWATGLFVTYNILRWFWG